MTALVREGFKRRGRQNGLQVGAHGLCDPAKRTMSAWGGAPEDLARVSPCKTLDNANGELIFTGPTKPLAVRSALSEASAMPLTPGTLEGENRTVDHSV